MTAVADAPVVDTSALKWTQRTIRIGRVGADRATLVRRAYKYWGGRKAKRAWLRLCRGEFCDRVHVAVAMSETAWGMGPGFGDAATKAGGSP